MTTRDVATDIAATKEGREMSVREQQVNDALRVLDEMHRLCRIEHDEYRQRRRQLLASLSDTTGGAGSITATGGIGRTGRDTVRRAVPAGEPLLEGTTTQRHDAGKREVATTRDRHAGTGRTVVCVLLLGVVAGAAAVCWFLMTA
jgi:hypothetical protein